VRKEPASASVVLPAFDLAENFHLDMGGGGKRETLEGKYTGKYLAEKRGVR
jgi:hypothetical protein